MQKRTRRFGTHVRGPFETQHTQYARYLKPPFDSYTDNMTCATARVYLLPINIPYVVTVDAVVVVYRDPAAGNRKAALYNDGTVADIPTGGALLASSPSGAKPGTNRKDEVVFSASIQLTPGLYWMAWVSDENTTRLIYPRYENTGGSLLAYYYDLAAYANPFTDPCPAVTASIFIPRMWLRVLSIS